MTGEVEFVGYFRAKAGRKSLRVELPGGSVTLYEFLQAVEETLSSRTFKILEGEKLLPGVLLFRRNRRGGLDRIFDLSRPMEEIEGEIVMAGLMGGG